MMQTLHICKLIWTMSELLPAQAWIVILYYETDSAIYGQSPYLETIRAIGACANVHCDRLVQELCMGESLFGNRANYCLRTC